MGFAKIISGGTDGRYTVELDYGESLRLQLLEARQAERIAVELRVAQVSLEVAIADGKEEAQRAKVQAAAESYIASTAEPLPPGSAGYSDVQFRFELQQLRALETASLPLRQQLQALKFDLEGLRRAAAALETLPAITQREAWCADFTEDRAPGAFVATVEVPGEPAITLIAPGARAWGPADGLVRARELMSPEQAFFNAAILPGWQRHKPTHRWGTIVALNKNTNRATVALSAQASSAQSLPINQQATLVDVPVTYMTCNAQAFELEDRVVVEFQGQNWESPRVVGFLDNPRACGGWVCTGYYGSASSGSFWFTNVSASRRDEISAALLDGAPSPFPFGPPLFRSSTSSIDVYSDGAWHRLYCNSILNAEGVLVGQPGTSFNPSGFGFPWSTNGPVLTSELLINDWIASTTPGFTHRAKTQLFAHPSPFPWFGMVDFRLSPTGEMMFELRLFSPVIGDPVPSLIQLRFVTPEGTVFLGAFSMFNGTVAGVKIENGFIRLPEGYTGQPIETLDIELIP